MAMMKTNCVVQAWGQHEGELRGYLVHRFLGDHQQSDDALQEIFLRAVKEGARFCELNNPRAWLFQVARNYLIDLGRLSESKQQVAPLEPDFPETMEHFDAVESLDKCLPSALQQLNQNERDLLIKCDLEGMRQADYAKLHGLGVSAVKSRIQRAREHLKKALEERCQVRYDDSGNVCCFVSCSDDPSKN